MQIEILSATINKVPTAKGHYHMADLAYKADGKVQGRKVPDFVCTEGFDLFKPGAVLDVFMVKEQGRDGKDYWQWKKVSPAGANTSSTPSASPSGVPTPRSNYETPEERKQRQDFIIRQSSLSNAVTVLKTDKVVPKVEDIIALANEFVDYVYKVKKIDPADPMAGLEDDIPY